MSGYTPSERFLSLFTTLRPREGQAALMLCAQAFFIMLAYYMLKVIREPMILAEGAAELKAYTTGMQAVILMAVVPLFGAAYRKVSDRQERYHLIRQVLLFFITNLLAFAAAYAMGWPIAIAYYVWLGIFSVIALATFWAFAADLYNLKSGQRIFPLIAAAASLGAFLGSGLTAIIDPLVGHHGVMVISALLLLVPWALSAYTEQRIPPGSRTAGRSSEPEDHHWLQGFRLVFRSRYLGLIATFVIVFNLVNTNGEFILASLATEAAAAAEAAGEMTSDAFLTSFYSDYNALFTLLSFLIQLFLVSRIFKLIGVRGSLIVLPALMIVSYSAMALLPILAVVRFAMVTENSLAYSLQSTTRHALFLPVSREEKYVGKHAIDTFFFRFGDVLSAGFVFVAGGLLGWGIAGFIGINIVLAISLTLLSLRIGRYNKVVIKQHPENLPPVIHRNIEDLLLPAGQLTHFELEEELFSDPDEGDALKYLALAGNGDRLPTWIKFDGLSRRFSFEPPPASTGEVQIRVVARDFDGLEASVDFKVSYR